MYDGSRRFSLARRLTRKWKKVIRERENANWNMEWFLIHRLIFMQITPVGGGGVSTTRKQRIAAIFLFLSRRPPPKEPMMQVEASKRRSDWLCGCSLMEAGAQLNFYTSRHPLFVSIPRQTSFLVGESPCGVAVNKFRIPHATWIMRTNKFQSSLAQRLFSSLSVCTPDAWTNTRREREI